MNLHHITAGTCALILFCKIVSAEVADKQSDIRFNQHIRPLLSEYCFACHGPDSASRKADLRLNLREDAVANEVIIPGNASESELIARITSDDPDFMMPPPGSRKQLNHEQKQLLARWVDAGAQWQEHWAFIPPGKVKLPRPRDVDKWARNAIDYFVLEKLHEMGLHPNDEADHHTLARRTALDVTGLPPDKEMLAAFVADSDEQAFSRYVDNLLESEHAGEHRARFWLDAARYGDTHGLHVDNYREIWPYRDWVIRSFNSNMPFDQFVIEQIAGDLLPAATLDQQIATGFNRCNITTSEGGAIPEEINVRYMVDRVETTATVFLGLTAGCAVCHDHKYDPISQREFYQFGAFFNNTTQPAMDGNQKDTAPVVTLPKAEFQDEWNQLQSRRKALRTELSQRNPQASEWWVSHPQRTDHPVVSDKLALWLPLTKGEGNDIELPATAQWATDHPEGRRGVRFGDGGGLTVDLPQLRSDEPLTISFWFRTPDRVLSPTLLEQTKTLKEENAESDKKTVGWKITSTGQGTVHFALLGADGKRISGVLPDNEALRPRSWQHVCVRYSGGQSKSSISIFANGQAASLRNDTESLVDVCELADTPLEIASNLPTGGLSDLRIFRRWLSDEEVRLLGQEYLLRKLLISDAAWEELDAGDQDLLASFYKQTADQDSRARSQELSATEKRRDYIYSRSTTTLVMQERPSLPRAWVLERGDYTQRREEVAPGVLAVLNGGSNILHSGPDNEKPRPLNRLDLARWLVNSDSAVGGLTARVMVNRLWQSLFGVGLVKTSEDFGAMGGRPTHLELLDWLAVEFVASGWNVNHILKLMVTSKTYRQSSVAVAEKIQKDPQNRFFARGPRRRLDAEVLRDQALAVSGLLRRDLGGPSVKPYQPAGLWKVVAITGSNTREFKPDSGNALYRRSIYTFWKRTSPPPSMAAFNAPTREQCTVRRECTNTPLQALVLMNDPQFVEAARQLAQTTLQRFHDDRSRASWILSNVLSRPAEDRDIAEIVSAADDFRDIFRQSSGAAQGLINTGESKPDTTLDGAELAAWTMVANTVMNRDDFVNK